MRLIYLFLYELKHTLIKIRRNAVLCFSTTIAMFTSIFLVSCCLVVGLHVDAFSQGIEQDVRIHVVLDVNIEKDSDLEVVQDSILAIKNVDTVFLSTKDNELELMIEEKGSAFEMYRGEENPLANAFFVTVKDGTKIDQTANQIKDMEEVVDVAYGGGSVLKMMNLLQKVRYVGYGMAGLLLLLSLYLIHNTIRTTIYSQQSEIAIMRQVGATRSFVKIPFELEGILIGFLGSLLSYLVIRFGYIKVYEMIGGVLFVHMLKLIEPSILISQIGWIILLTGTVLGWLASSMAVSKYVRKTR